MLLTAVRYEGRPGEGQKAMPVLRKIPNITSPHLPSLNWRSNAKQLYSLEVQLTRAKSTLPRSPCSRGCMISTSTASPHIVWFVF